MKRHLAFIFVWVLAMTGCHRVVAPPAVANKESDTSAKDGPAAKPLFISPQMGRPISSEEVPLLEQINRENTRVLAAVVPGVVRITSSRVIDPRTKLFDKIPFQFHFGLSTRHQIQDLDPSYGSGVILSKDGYIVTNNHVIENSRDIEVQLHDKRLFPAHVIASDTSLDIAVLKIETTGLPVVSWGNSNHIQVGEQIFAVGAPFNQEGSVSRGIVSATERSLPDSPNDENYIQTDAAINPGNSGGPLVNIHGELIGINTLIASTSGGNEGVGFAIPSNLVSHAVESLLREANTVRGYLGIHFPKTIDDGVRPALQLGSKQGALLADIDSGSPAEKAGLKTGDFITGFDGHRISGMSDLRLLFSQVPIGKEVAVNYLRDGATQSTKVKIIAAPVELQSAGNPPAKSPAARDALSNGANALAGLQVYDLNDKSRRQFGLDKDITAGVVTSVVEYSSPADMKGITRGDVIESVSIDHGSTRRLSSVKDFADVASGLKPDQGVVLLVHHGKTSSFIYLTPQN